MQPPIPDPDRRVFKAGLTLVPNLTSSDAEEPAVPDRRTARLRDTRPRPNLDRFVPCSRPRRLLPTDTVTLPVRDLLSLLEDACYAGAASPFAERDERESIRRTLKIDALLTELGLPWATA